MLRSKSNKLWSQKALVKQLGHIKIYTGNFVCHDKGVAIHQVSKKTEQHRILKFKIIIRWHNVYKVANQSLILTLKRFRPIAVTIHSKWWDHLRSVFLASHRRECHRVVVLTWPRWGFTSARAVSISSSRREGGGREGGGRGGLFSACVVWALGVLTPGWWILLPFIWS